MTTSTLNTTDLVKKLYEAFAQGDIPYILASVTPDCQWINAGPGIPAAGSYTGPAGVGEFFQKLAASEEVTRFEPRQYFVSEDGNVVAHGFEECRIISNGKMVSTNWMMLFRFNAEGKVTRWESFYDTAAYALAHSGK